MSRGYTCRECGRKFAQFVLRPPGCANPDLCDVQADPEPDAKIPGPIPILAPEPVVNGSEATPPPSTAEDSTNEVDNADPLAEFLAEKPNAKDRGVREKPLRADSPPVPPPQRDEAVHPVVGGVWRGWIVQHELRDLRPGRAFYFLDSRSAEGALWREAASEINANVAERLDRITEPAVLRPERIAGVTGSLIRLGRRMPWSAGRHSAGSLYPLIQELGRAIHALHQEGLAHLNIHPDAVWWESSSEGPHFALAGSDEAVFTGAPGAFRRDPDLLYDSPELLGRHLRIGQSLQAADWFSLGRVAQTMLLGGSVFDRLYPVREGNASERSMLIEAHLREDGGTRSMRAGAVEAASEGELTPAQHKLLRGLLTTNPVGRWGFAEITEWLRHRSPADHYGMHARETLFHFGDRAFTVEEAAAALASAELWSHAAAEVFERNRKNSLAAYVTAHGSDPKFAETWDRLMKHYRDGVFGREYEARREIVTGLYLAFLGGEKVGLSCRGKRLNRALLIERVQAARRDPAAWEWCEVMGRGITYLEVERVDSAATGVLRAWRDPIYAVGEWLEADELPLPESQDERTDLMLAALASDEELRPKHIALREGFAKSRVRRVHDWLRAEQLTRHQLVYLAYVTGGRRGEDLGLVTHEEWTRLETKRLLGEAADPAAMLTWLRLRRALWAAWLLRRGGLSLLLLWSLTGVAGAYVEEGRRFLIGLIAGVGMGLLAKVGLYLLARRSVSRVTGWKNAPKELLLPTTSQTQLRRIAGGAAIPKASLLAKRVNEINRELATLRRKEGRRPKVYVRSMTPIWILATIVTLSWAGVWGVLWIRQGDNLKKELVQRSAHWSWDSLPWKSRAPVRATPTQMPKLTPATATPPPVPTVPSTNAINSPATSTIEQSRMATLFPDMALDPYGMRFKILREGQGKKPIEGSHVTLHYIGRLFDGTEFVNTYKRGKPVEYEVVRGRMMRGWELTLKDMRKGERRQVVIPFELAYGTRSVPPIPPRATLIFELELVDIH